MTKMMMRRLRCICMQCMYVCNVLGRSCVIDLIGRRNMDGGGKE